MDPSVHPQLIYSFSEPTVTSNRAKEEIINVSHFPVDPSSVDIIESTFYSRSVYIQYKDEIASLNEGCYFRIEIPLEELGKRSCDITFELYHQKLIADKFKKSTLKFDNQEELVSSHVLTINSIGVATTMSYLPLLYTEDGFADVRGLLITSLLEIRYQPQIEEGYMPITFGEYMFGQADTLETLDGLYTEQKKSLFGCLKVSYDSIKQYIIHITNIASSLQSIQLPDFRIPETIYEDSSVSTQASVVLGYDKDSLDVSKSDVPSFENVFSTMELKPIESSSSIINESPVLLKTNSESPVVNRKYDDSIINNNAAQSTDSNLVFNPSPSIHDIHEPEDALDSYALQLSPSKSDEDHESHENSDSDNYGNPSDSLNIREDLDVDRYSHDSNSSMGEDVSASKYSNIDHEYNDWNIISCSKDSIHEELGNNDEIDVDIQNDHKTTMNTSHYPYGLYYSKSNSINKRHSLEHMESDYDNDYLCTEPQYARTNKSKPIADKRYNNSNTDQNYNESLLFKHDFVSKSKHNSSIIPPLESLDFDSMMTSQSSNISGAKRPGTTKTSINIQNHASFHADSSKEETSKSRKSPLSSTSPLSQENTTKSNTSPSESNTDTDTKENENHKIHSKLGESPLSPVVDPASPAIKRIATSTISSTIHPNVLLEKPEIRRTESFSMMNLKNTKFENQLENYGIRFCKEITAGGTQVLDLWQQFIQIVRDNISLLVGELEYEYFERLFDSFGYFIYTEHNDIHNICEEQRDIKEYHQDIIKKIKKSSLFSSNSPILLNPYPVYSKEFDVVNPKNICILIEQTYIDILHDSASGKNHNTSNLDQLNSRFPLYEWKCSDTRCNTINPRHCRICKRCLNTLNVNYFNNINNAIQTKTNYFNNDLHVVFFVHGLKARAKDMKLMSQCFSYIYPHIIAHECISCENITEKPIYYQAEQLAKEVSRYLQNIRTNVNTTKHLKISFVAHSLGGLVVRQILTLPELAPYLTSLNFYLSLNTPHFGVLTSKSWYEIGAKFIAMFNSGSMDELTFSNKDYNENPIVQLALNNTLHYFKHIYLCSSLQDNYTPFLSVRAEIPYNITNQSKEFESYKELVHSFYSKIDPDKVTKFDFYFPFHESFINKYKAAHVELLVNIDAIFMLLLRLQNSFN